MYWVRARRSELSPKKMSCDKHSSFTDRTQRSANAFRLGLRAGNFSGVTLPAFNHLPKPWTELPITIVQQIAAVREKAPILHRHVASLLLHPQLVWIRGYTRQAHPPRLQ